jgi:hypothetical protein
VHQTVITLPYVKKQTKGGCLQNAEGNRRNAGRILFLRVHHSFLVNLNEVNKYVKGEGGYLIMSDDSTVDVSRSKKEMLLKKLHPGRS